MKKWFCALMCALLLAGCLGANADPGASACPDHDDGKHRAYEVTELEEPTCSNYGCSRVKCSCGYSWLRDDDKDPQNHCFEQTDMTYPTCTQPGYIYIECIWCGNQDTQVNEAYGHDFDAWEVVEFPTCGEDGLRRRCCFECGEWETEPIAANGHSFGDWVVVEEPSCTEDGLMTNTCYDCGETVPEVIPAAGHVKGDEFVMTDATDHSVGVTGSVCADCGATFETGTFYPDGTLYRGMGKNDDVTAMQRKLIDTGFLNDKADGVFGRNTEAAVTAFQKAMGIEQTGVAFPQTLRMLEEYVGGEAPEPEAGEPFAEEIYPCCGVELCGDGLLVYRYCPEHAALMDATDALLMAMGDDLTRQQTLWEQIYRMWQDECDRLFSRWAARYEGEIREAVEACHGAFNASLAADMELQRLLAADYPPQGEVYGTERLQEKCRELCAILFESA